MNIKIIDCPKGTEPVLEKQNGNYIVRFVEKTLPELKSIAPGEKVKIGEWTFIVLEHMADSPINGILVDFEQRLIDVVGEDKVFWNEIDLTALDGTNAGSTHEMRTPLLTIDMLRKYGEILEPKYKWWWLATPASIREGYARNVCYVYSNGAVHWNNCGWRDGGVRPFCTLDSSILVERSE